MTSDQNSSATRLLLVEDNPVDVLLLRFALEQEKNWPVEITVVEDGEKAIYVLTSQAADPYAAKPDAILLDLNLPRRDGTEVLQIIRTTESLSSLPVAIVSSSPRDVIEDQLNAAHVHADGYFIKPMGIENFTALGKALRTWYEQQQRKRHAAGQL
jgi:two-component system, chemotaxis family, response regulator Rcp1